jgi:Leucine-rich repeat (LRR) protein
MKLHGPPLISTSVLLVLLLVASSTAPIAAQIRLTPETFDCSAVTEIPSVECEALVALYNSTNGSGWTNQTGWLASNTPCSWYGVSCYGGHVERLYLPSNQLSGSIPPDLRYLVNLQGLYLDSNQLSGSIPPQLGDLVNLQTLSLNNNQLSGSVPPQLGDLLNLQRLYLHNNQLSGSIPPQLGDLVNLQGLSLNNNQLSGPLPQSLTNLHALSSFYYDTDLLCAPGNAAFQAWLAGIRYKPPDITTCVDFDCTSVSEIPPSECEALVALYNYANGAGWTNHGGWFIASIPCSWYGVSCNTGHVITLLLPGNQLSGSIPPELRNLTNLQGLYLESNQLSGSIPPELGDLVNLQDLWLFSNQLSGSIPPELGDLVNLLGLDLDSNQLSGSIPPELGKLANLQGLWLDVNQLSGPLPQSLTNLHALSHFYYDTGLLCSPDNGAFQAWLAGIPSKSTGAWTCKTCYLPAVMR